MGFEKEREEKEEGYVEEKREFLGLKYGSENCHLQELVKEKCRGGKMLINEVHDFDFFRNFWRGKSCLLVECLGG